MTRCTSTGWSGALGAAGEQAQRRVGGDRPGRPARRLLVGGLTCRHGPSPRSQGRRGADHVDERTRAR